MCTTTMKRTSRGARSRAKRKTKHELKSSNRDWCALGRVFESAAQDCARLAGRTVPVSPGSDEAVVRRSTSVRRSGGYLKQLIRRPRGDITCEVGEKRATRNERSHCKAAVAGPHSLASGRGGESVASAAEFKSVASAEQYFSCIQTKSLLHWHADLRNEGSNSPTLTRAPENGGRMSELRTET